MLPTGRQEDETDPDHGSAKASVHLGQNGLLALIDTPQDPVFGCRAGFVEAGEVRSV
jgi:hypothetical protein